jgi:hypothetical protein
MNVINSATGVPRSPPLAVVALCRGFSKVPAYRRAKGAGAIFKKMDAGLLILDFL